MDPLRDAEARVRALTREVGSLREDLRRELKRRERAVVQTKEAEALRVTAESNAAESAYSSKKLTGELEASHADSRRAADRDRRALRVLREGLAGVEAAVAARGHTAAQQVRSATVQLHQLAALLFPLSPSHQHQQLASTPTSPSPLPATLAPSVALHLSATAKILAQIGHSLGATADPGASSGGGGRALDSGGSGSAGAERETLASGPCLQADGAAGGGHASRFLDPNGAGQAVSVQQGAGGMGHSRLPPGSSESGAGASGSDSERGRLHEGVLRLRAEVRSAGDRSAGGMAGRAGELQEALSLSQGELVRLRGEGAEMGQRLQQSGREAHALRAEIAGLVGRLQQRDVDVAEVLSRGTSQEARLQQAVAQMGRERAGLEGQHLTTLCLQIRQLQHRASSLASAAELARREVTSLSAQLASREGLLSEQSSKLERMQGERTSQNEDLLAALQLVATSHRQTTLASAASPRKPHITHTTLTQPDHYPAPLPHRAIPTTNHHHLSSSPAHPLSPPYPSHPHPPFPLHTSHPSAHHSVLDRILQSYSTGTVPRRSPRLDPSFDMLDPLLDSAPRSQFTWLGPSQHNSGVGRQGLAALDLEAHNHDRAAYLQDNAAAAAQQQHDLHTHHPHPVQPYPASHSPAQGSLETNTAYQHQHPLSSADNFGHTGLGDADTRGGSSSAPAATHPTHPPREHQPQAGTRQHQQQQQQHEQHERHPPSTAPCFTQHPMDGGRSGRSAKHVSIDSRRPCTPPDQGNDRDPSDQGAGCLRQVQPGKENAETGVVVVVRVEEQRQRQRRQEQQGGGGGKQQVAMLRRDMQSLDDEIAQLEASMQAAAAKLR
ncbi:MAG: hypothetical protein WDW36_007514 [Sanguina aurantia]